MSAPDWKPTVGGGATVCHYSDRTACTVTRVSSSGKTVWMQEDIAVHDNWKPEFVAGGFAGRRLDASVSRQLDCTTSPLQRSRFAQNEHCGHVEP